MTQPVAPETYRAFAELDGAWWVVTVPDLPGVFTQGRTYEQARAMACDAIATILDVPRDNVAVALELLADG